MLVSVPDERRLFGRRRRENLSGEQRREKAYRVYVSPEEDAHLRARAEVLGVTVPRLLFESAMNAQVRTDTEWKGAVAELFAIRRLMATVANNVNQIAKFANAEGRFVEEAREVVAEHRSIVTRMNAVLDRLAGR